jgi:hypothetical protein
MTQLIDNNILEEKILGLLSFKYPIQCDKTVHGSEIPVSIGGIIGILWLPNLPDLVIKNQDEWRDRRLIPPLPASTWKQGEELIRWGETNGNGTITHLSGDSRIEKCFLEFSTKSKDIKTSSQAIYDAFPKWNSLFLEYYELISKQRLLSNLKFTNNADNLELYHINKTNNFKSLQNSNPGEIQITLNTDPYMNKQSFITICDYCSTSMELALEYRVILEAYRAFRSHDYRKSIIESATAAEVALEKAIRFKLLSTGITYADKLLNKFQMLKARFELAEMININLPDLDYSLHLIQPRNKVVHKADFANQQIAFKAIQTVDELLRNISPSLSEQFTIP